MIVKETLAIEGSITLATNQPSSFYYTGVLKEIRYRPYSSKHWPTTSIDLMLYRGTATGSWNKSKIWAQMAPGASEVSFFPQNRITTTTTEAVTRTSSQYTDVVFVDQRALLRMTTAPDTTELNCYIDLFFDGIQHRTSERGAKVRNQTSMLNL